MPLNVTTKDKILDMAATLFYQQGILKTGLDEIAQAVGITKPSLYYHFSSKEDLLVQAMAHLSEVCRADYIKAWEGCPKGTDERLTVLFTVIHANREAGDFYGCPFLNAAIELRGQKTGIGKIAQNHYGFVMEKLTHFASDAGLNQPDMLAKKLTTLLLATYANVAVTGAPDAVTQTLALANAAINEHRKH